MSSATARLLLGLTDYILSNARVMSEPPPPELVAQRNAVRAELVAESEALGGILPTDLPPETPPPHLERVKL